MDNKVVESTGKTLLDGKFEWFNKECDCDVYDFEKYLTENEIEIIYELNDSIESEE